MKKLLIDFSSGFNLVKNNNIFVLCNDFTIYRALKAKLPKKIAIRNSPFSDSNLVCQIQSSKISQSGLYLIDYDFYNNSGNNNLREHLNNINSNLQNKKVYNYKSPSFSSVAFIIMVSSDSQYSFIQSNLGSNQNICVIHKEGNFVSDLVSGIINLCEGVGINKGLIQKKKREVYVFDIKKKFVSNYLEDFDPISYARNPFFKSLFGILVLALVGSSFFFMFFSGNFLIGVLLLALSVIIGLIIATMSVPITSMALRRSYYEVGESNSAQDFISHINDVISTKVCAYNLYIITQKSFESLNNEQKRILLNFLHKIKDLSYIFGFIIYSEKDSKTNFDNFVEENNLDPSFIWLSKGRFFSDNIKFMIRDIQKEIGKSFNRDQRIRYEEMFRKE